MKREETVATVTAALLGYPEHLIDAACAYLLITTATPETVLKAVKSVMLYRAGMRIRMPTRWWFDALSCEMESGKETIITPLGSVGAIGRRSGRLISFIGEAKPSSKVVQADFRPIDRSGAAYVWSIAAIAAKPRRCRVCQSHGHDVRNCPDREHSTRTDGAP